jgi:hypothetical protein
MSEVDAVWFVLAVSSNSTVCKAVVTATTVEHSELQIGWKSDALDENLECGCFLHGTYRAAAFIPRAVKCKSEG